MNAGRELVKLLGVAVLGLALFGLVLVLAYYVPASVILVALVALGGAALVVHSGRQARAARLRCDAATARLRAGTERLDASAARLRESTAALAASNERQRRPIPRAAR